MVVNGLKSLRTPAEVAALRGKTVAEVLGVSGGSNKPIVDEVPVDEAPAVEAPVAEAPADEAPAAEEVPA